MIIIKTPQPDLDERLVVVPLDAVRESLEGSRLALSGCVARDATPEDLARGGYVPSVGHLPRREVETAVSDAMDLQRRLIEAEGHAAELALERDDAIARAEKAERERDAAIALADALDRELRAAGGDPEALAARGLAFVRECQAKRATDEELERAYSVAYARAWESDLSTPDRGERAGIRAVAAQSCPFCASRISVIERDGVFVARCSHRGCGARGPKHHDLTRACDLFCCPPQRTAGGMGGIDAGGAL